MLILKAGTVNFIGQSAIITNPLIPRRVQNLHIWWRNSNKQAVKRDGTNRRDVKCNKNANCNANNSNGASYSMGTASKAGVSSVSCYCEWVRRKYHHFKLLKRATTARRNGCILAWTMAYLYRRPVTYLNGLAGYVEWIQWSGQAS